MLLTLTDRSVSASGMISKGTRANKRQDIIDAAVRLLAAGGPEGFTASALAAEAGVSKANLFHHFEALDDIVLEGFEQYAEAMELFRPPAGTDLRWWLLGMGEASFGVEGTGAPLARAYTVFVAKALFDERLRTRVLATVNRACEAFADIVSDSYAGEMSRDEALAMASLIFMTGDGAAIHLQAFPERRNVILAAWRAFVDRVAPETGKDGS